MKFINTICKTSSFMIQKRCLNLEPPIRGVPYKEPKTIKEFFQRLKENHKNLPKNLKMTYEALKADLKDKFSTDAFIDHLSYKYFAKFREMSAEDFSRWTVTTDAMQQGLTTASLVKHPERGTAIFSGKLNTTVPQTGDIVRSGLASIKSPYRVRFGQIKSMNFYPYNFFIIKYRGDGRSYALNIHMNHHLDIMWHDQYTSPLYTKGGPYWQIAKIPFHKFFLTSRGRIQDIQGPIFRNSVRHVSISLMDQIDGEFQLEVDYMGIQRESLYNEAFSYEGYYMPSRGHRFK